MLDERTSARTRRPTRRAIGVEHAKELRDELRTSARLGASVCERRSRGLRQQTLQRECTSLWSDLSRSRTSP